MDVEEPFIASDEKAKCCRRNDAIKNLKVNYYICRYNCDIYFLITFHRREPFYIDLRRAARFSFFRCCCASKASKESKAKKKSILGFCILWLNYWYRVLLCNMQSIRFSSWFQSYRATLLLATNFCIGPPCFVFQAVPINKTWWLMICIIFQGFANRNPLIMMGGNGTPKVEKEKK